LSVYLALEATADCLTSRDLLRIMRAVEIADQFGGAVHISPGSWLVLVNASEVYHRSVAEALRNIGYECDVFSGGIDELSTFDLSTRKEEHRDAVSV